MIVWIKTYSIFFFRVLAVLGMLLIIFFLVIPYLLIEWAISDKNAPEDYYQRHLEF